MAEPEIDPERLSFEFTVAEGKPRLDEFIAGKLPKVSLTRIRRLIAEGDALVNGANSLKGARLRPDDRVSVKLFAAEKSSGTPEAIPLEVLHEDAEIIVLNKQVGLLVHPSGREKSGTLMNALAWHFWQSSGEAIRPGLVHRLDRNTSGVIIIAKTLRAHRTLSKHFRERWVKKFYQALVCGRVATSEGEIDAPIGFDPAIFPHWRVMREGKETRPAQTRYKVRTRYANHTLLELEPLTGRTHQLRIHCQLIGHAIVGDPFYKGAADELAGALRLKHHQLHASRLELKHPATGQPMIFNAPMPQAMRSLLDSLS
ncbi:MAG: RluA family pseudouridine synthase [Blastocatellia bacterium]|nr:RluA family pseudouridine synthase [Blastocatellia bacterium]